MAVELWQSGQACRQEGREGKPENHSKVHRIEEWVKCIEKEKLKSSQTSESLPVKHQTSAKGHEIKFLPDGRTFNAVHTVRDISGNVGLVSAGRINKDTPPLTTPSYTSKSSAMDTSSYIF